MSTESKIIIERRDKERDNWGYFDTLAKDEPIAKELWRLFEKYPQHRFRAVRITTTREVLK